jgi:hypothetical protein
MTIKSFFELFYDLASDVLLGLVKKRVNVLRSLILRNNKGGVSHCGLAIYIKKYLKAKEEELWKLKYFTMQKYNLLHKKSSKRNQNPL